jgi:hypothetical protein
VKDLYRITTDGGFVRCYCSQLPMHKFKDGSIASRLPGRHHPVFPGKRMGLPFRSQIGNALSWR